MFLSTDENSVKFSEFIRPFTKSSWIAIIAFLIIGIAALSLTIGLQPYTDRIHDNGLSFVIVIAGFAQQGIYFNFLIAEVKEKKSS